MCVQSGDLAIVVQGLWPNVGRIVFVDTYKDLCDFTALGLPPSGGWRVRSVSAQPLQTTEGYRMAGVTPEASLRRLEPLPPEQMKAIAQKKAIADFKEAMDRLVEIFEVEEKEAVLVG